MDWTALRDEFPVTRHWAFLDHAAVAPLPRRTRDAWKAWADDVADHGVVSSLKWFRRVNDVRSLCGRLLNCDPLDVAFVKNTSEGIGFVAEGYPWQAGDNVVTAADEYPSNVYPWLNLARRGVELRRVPCPGGRLLIDDLAAAIDGRTRVVTLSHVEFASGFRNDLDAIGNLCRERGVHFFVDAIQGLGVLPLDVSRTPVDFLSADGHKWLLGPEGAGVFYVRRELVEVLRPVSVGWHSVVDFFNFSNIDLSLQPHAGRWECGTPNMGGVHALGESVALLLELGVPAVAERVLALTDHLCDKAARAGIEVYSSRRPGEASGIVSLVVPGAEERHLVRRCREAGVVVNLRSGRIRLSPHCYNTEDELTRAVEVLATT
jgi:cysteine desulfurase / selenocysteine lyase